MDRKKVYCFDIDGTITNETEGWDYTSRTPRVEVIEQINRLYNSGKFHIVLWTSRRPIDDKVTRDWLRKWEVNFHKIKYDKPFWDLYICDKVENVNSYCILPEDC